MALLDVSFEPNSQVIQYARAATPRRQAMIGRCPCACEVMWDGYPDETSRPDAMGKQQVRKPQVLA
jgi:hypothetical protein